MQIRSGQGKYIFGVFNQGFIQVFVFKTSGGSFLFVSFFYGKHNDLGFLKIYLQGPILAVKFCNFLLLNSDKIQMLAIGPAQQRHQYTKSCYHM